MLKLLSIVFVLVAIAGSLTAWQDDIAASAVTGLGAGLALLVFSLRGVTTAIARHTPANDR